MRTKPASLQAFIAEECAGHVNGRCIEHGDSGGPCTVIEGRTRCSYLERCVLPIATGRLRTRYAQGPRDDTPAVAEYRRIQERLDDRQTKPCPECGRPIPTRARLCSACRKARRRDTFRRSQGKRRLMSTVSAPQVGQPQ